MMDKKQSFVLLILFLAAFSPQVSGQKYKPIVKANRKKEFIVTGIGLESQLFRDNNDPLISVRKYYKQGYDSVTVYRNSRAISTFRAKGRYIEEPCYIEYHENGKIKQIDSLSPGRVTVSYFGFFDMHIAVSKEYYSNGILKKILYSTLRGKDSVSREWFDTGILKQCRERDSMEYNYYESGILKSVRSLQFYSARKTEFYETGILKSESGDTTIGVATIQYLREYTDKGTISSLKYFSHDTPAHIWLDYDNEGKLIKTSKYKPLSEIPPEVYGIAEEPEYILIHVDEKPEKTVYKPDDLLEARLLDLLCRSQVELRGKYTVRVEIENGLGKLLSIEGENEFAIRLLMMNAVMYDWRAQQTQNDPVSEIQVFELEVRSSKRR